MNRVFLAMLWTVMSVSTTGCDAPKQPYAITPARKGEIDFDVSRKAELEGNIAEIQARFGLMRSGNDAVSVVQGRKVIVVFLRDPDVDSPVECLLITDIKGPGRLEYQIYREGFATQVRFDEFVSHVVPKLESLSIRPAP